MFVRAVRAGGPLALLLAGTVAACSASGPSGNAPGDPTQKRVDGGAGPDASDQGPSLAGGNPSCPGDAGSPAGRAIIWADGTSQNAGTTVASGTTVVIAPGATIGMGTTAIITVQGTLVAHSACGPHAHLAWSAGAAPTSGIVVAPGGTLLLDGVDVTGAGAALTVLAGAAAEYDHATIDGSAAPFTVAAGGILKTTGAAVVDAKGASSVSGSLVAAYLDYNANGNSGIVAEDSATVDIRNSKLHGDGPDADMVISEGSTGGTVHVSNTEIYDVHCAFHFGPVASFDISYANIHDNAYGFMLYGSGPAGGTMKYSNVDPSNQVAFEPAGTNGTITFDHCYIPGGSPAAPVVLSNPAASPVAGTGPM